MPLKKLPVDRDCLFCKMAAGEIPCSKVYEDEHILAFMDINPVSKGHTLVIPKGHWPGLLEIPEGMGGPLLGGLAKVAAAVTEEAGADGFNIMQNNKAAAGQVIFHFHWHIVPRFEGDGLTHWPGEKCNNFETLNSFAKSANERIIRSGGAYE